jgi:hypothetical protein
MSKLIVNLNNVHRDEQAILKDHLDDNCWQVEELTQDEQNGLISILQYVIDARVGDNASKLSYLELLNLKNKLSK